jgi:hypothetical protein
MSKVKMKCAHCGKHFKSSNTKQVLCPDCEARERRARAAGKASPARSAQPVSASPAAAPKIVGPGAGILVPGMTPPPPVPAPEPATGAASRAPGERHPAAPGQALSPAQTAAADKAARHAQPPKGQKQVKAAKAPTEPRKPREPRPQTPPFELTDDLRARIEARYLELAQPVEYNGIRTQITAELGIPKAAVKRVVQDLRGRMQLPSWWDLRSYDGTDEDLARIRAAYEPLLPVPEVGIHKQIAADLDLSPLLVYQGIRRIRAEMRLPQYNPPELHAPANPPVAPEAPESPAPESPAGAAQPATAP